MPKYGRTAKISIDIGEQAVNVIKTNGSGVVTRAGSAELTGDTSDYSRIQYSAIYATSILQAAKRAGVKGGGNCVMVVGGPQVITRCFVWPEMPPDSLQFNAESEISHYLPSEITQFTVSYRILRRTATQNDGKPAVQLDVFVTAIAKEMSEALLWAAKIAGFSPMRIDVRENSRDKLVHTPALWQGCSAKPGRSAKKREPDAEGPDSLFNPDSSFAILNISDRIANMTVFVNGVFYAGRYFGIHAKAPAQEYAMAGQSGGAPAQDSEPVRDIDTLVTEVASIIDYIQYRERSYKVGSILLFGDDDKSMDLAQVLSEYLEIPVFQTAERLKAVFKRQRYGCGAGLTRFLDAYGAALALPDGFATDINLKPKKKKRHIFKMIVLPVLCLLLILGTLLAAGVYFPYRSIQELEAEDQRLAAELARYIIPGNVGELRREVSRMGKILEESDEFYLPGGASAVLRVIYTALPSNTTLRKISVDEKTVTLSGSTDSISKVDTLIVSLRSNPQFAGANPQFVDSYPVGEKTVVDFEIKLAIAHTEAEG